MYKGDRRFTPGPRGAFKWKMDRRVILLLLNSKNGINDRHLSHEIQSLYYDNFLYTDDSERYELDEYPALDDAIHA